MEKFKAEIKKAVRNQNKFIILPEKIAEYVKDERWSKYNIRIDAEYTRYGDKGIPTLEFKLRNDEFIYMGISIEDLTDTSIDFVITTLINYATKVMII